MYRKLYKVTDINITHPSVKCTRNNNDKNNNKLNKLLVFISPTGYKSIAYRYSIKRFLQSCFKTTKLLYIS